MDDNANNETPEKGFNQIDLTQLQGFSFGTQWTQDKSAPREPRRDSESRDNRREGGYAGEPKKDRRAFRKPAGPVGETTGPAGAGAGAGQREGEGNRGPRRDFRGGGFRDQGGGDRGGYGDRRGGPRFGSREAPVERGPYISPYFNVTFYPEDIGFTALAKAIRTSCRTYELFEIARVIIGKNDRFVAVVQRKPAEGSAPAAGTAPATPAEKPAPLAMSVPDNLPFENEEAAVAHVLTKHIGAFFDVADVEVEAPKGNFQVVNKCGITGELLGPPNYHRYAQIVQQHFATRISRMSIEAYRTRIETVRDPEVINQWLAKMKKTTRYTWKLVAEGEVAPTFDAFEDARTYLLSHARDKVVKPIDSARLHGKLIETVPVGEIRRAIEGTLERQRRFPLDTANALRGRLRREGFTIFKKGSKGVSYVCAVKRKFRVPGQTFSDSIGALISFIETNPMVKASELPAKLLGIQLPAAAPSTPTQSPIPTDGSVPPVDATPAAGPAPTPLSAEEQSKLQRLNGDLRWLVSEGYVTEFIDGRLFAPPAMTEARKQEVEKDDHDPENFPEAPAAAPAAPAAVSEPAPHAEAAESAPDEKPVDVAPAADSLEQAAPVETASEASATTPPTTPA